MTRITAILITALLTSCAQRLPPPPTDSICLLDPVVLYEDEIIQLSDESIDQVLRNAEAICAACPSKTSCPGE